MRNIVRIAMGISTLAVVVAGDADAFDPLETDHCFDIIVLTHDSFAAQAEGFLDNPNLRGCVVTTSEMLSAFGGGAGVPSVNHLRALAEYAYTSWRIAPSYLILVGDACYEDPAFDLVPSYMRVNEWWQEVGWPCETYCWEYADDGWIVRGVGTDQKPIMHIGRVPSRTSADVANYLAKRNLYNAQSPGSDIFFLAGDRDTNGVDNSVMRTVCDNLMNLYVPSWCSTSALYAADYGEGYPESATEDTRVAWNSGHTLVNAFGNDMSECDLVLMAYGFCCDEPTFTQHLNENTRLPVVFGGTCLLNFFFGQGPSVCQYPRHCVAEDLLFSSPDRGAIATFASNHVTPCFDNAQMNRVFLESAFKDGIWDLGRLCTATEVEYLREGLGWDWVALEYCLLGDPTLRLNLPPWQQGEDPRVWRSGAEIEDSWIGQEIYVECSTGISNPNLRLLGQDGTASPPCGERMIRATANVEQPGAVDAVEWKLARPGRLDRPGIWLPLQNGMLTFRMRVEESPAQASHVSLDGLLNGGSSRLSWHDDVIFDQHGIPLAADLRTPLPEGWNLLYFDLTCAPATWLEGISLRCTPMVSEVGSLLVYVDDIQIRLTDASNSEQELLNVDFEEDEDLDGRPDFWTNLDGEYGDEVCLSDFSVYSGRYSVRVSDLEGTGQGMKQLVHVSQDREQYRFRFMARANVLTEISYRVVRVDNEETICMRTAWIDRDWRLVGCTFDNPWYPGDGISLVSVQVCPGSGHLAYIDSTSMTGGLFSSVTDQARPVPLAGTSVHVAPNPANPTCEIQFQLAHGGDVSLAIFDVNGRLVSELARARLIRGIHHRAWDGRDTNGNAVASGIYFCRLAEGKRAITKKIVVVR